MNLKTKLLATVFKTLVVFGFLLTVAASNAQIATWNYDPLLGTSANPTSNTGSGTSSILPDAAQFPNNSFQGRSAGCGAPDAGFSWGFDFFNPGTNTESNGVQYNVSTVGYTSITFAWDMRFSNTAPNTIRMQYTSDGSTWVNVDMNTVSTTICAGAIAANGCYVMDTSTSYRHLVVDFTSIPAVANNANFGVRILAAYDPNYGTAPTYGGFRQTTDSTLPATNTGTWRFDNVVVGGTIQPGPTASVISGTTSICNGFSTNLSVAMTGGTGPFTLVYTDGTTNFTVLNYTSGAAISITPTATKSYTIVSVTNANGQPGTGNSGTATVTVKAKPTVTLSSGTACPGNFNLNTLITTAASPSGGSGFFSRTSSPATPIASPATYAGATIPDLIYTYTGPNGCVVVSNQVTFTRNAAPVFTTQPSGSQTVCQGSAFTPITIAVTSATAVTYQWYYNSTATFVGATTIALSNTASYIPPSTSAYGPRYFAVRATNTCASTNSTSWAGPFYVTTPTVAGTVAGAQTICANTAPTTDLVLSGNTGTVVKWERANDVGFTSGVADIASTSTTLTGATIGSLSQTTYIRAYVQNGTCAVVTTTPVQILIKSTTYYSPGGWNNGAPDSGTTAIFEGDYSSTGDLNACAVQVNSGNVVINSNHTLTIQNGLTVSGGALTFEDKASLVQVNNSTNSGVITYKRRTTSMRKFDYTYWSTPVDGQILANLSPLTLSDKYFWFNTTIYNWNAVAAPGLTFMDIGKGYIIRAPQTFDPVTAAVYEGSFIGTPNNGDYSVSIVKTGANDLNCIGNPYPSALNADAFIAQNTGAFGATPGTTLYFWTHNTPITNNVYTFSDYATYNYSGGTGAGLAAPGANTTIPNGKIAAGQAFMVKGIIAGTTTATFKNSMRAAGNNDRFFRLNSGIGTAPLERNRVWLELKNNQGAYKQILVGYIQNATNALDNGYDGEVLEAGNSVSFYSVLEDKKLAIQGRSLPFVSNDQIPLGYKTSAATSFQINLSDFDGLFGNQEVYLEDTLLHVIHNLKAAPYEFVTELGTFNTRFVLRFTNSALGVTDAVWNENTVIAYENLGQIVVSSSTLKLANVSVYDLSGRLLYDHQKVNAKEISFPVGTAAKVLLIRITSENNQTVTKKILR